MFKTLFFILSLFFLSKTFAQAEVGQEALENIRNGVVKIELNNGLRILIHRRTESPIFTGYIWVKVGGVNEVTGLTGVSHFLEHMAFKGTTTIGTKDFEKEKVLLSELEKFVSKTSDQEQLLKSTEYQRIEGELEKLWVDEEFSTIYSRRGQSGLNAMTSNDFTAYLVSLPKTAFELWCWLESDRLINPVFRQFYKEREVVQEERRMRTDDDPDGKAYEALLASAFWSHPNRLPDIGWPSDVKNLTATKMKKHWDTYYRPDNIVITLVGDIDPLQAKPLLERYFSRWKNPELPLPKVITEEVPQQGERDITVEFDAEPRLLLAYHAPIYPDPDDSRMELLHEVLSGSRSSILYRELVLKKRIAADVGTTDEPSLAYPTLFVVYANPVKGVSTQTLRDEIQSIFDRIKKEGISQQDLEGAKMRIKVNYLKRMGTNSGFGYLLGLSELLWGDYQILFTRYQNVLAATSEDLKAFSKRYLIKSHRTFVHVEKSKGEEESGI